MKYLPDNLVAYQCDYETYSQYVIMRKESEDENKIYGPGIEVTINYPKSEYMIYSDYNVGDKGWDKLFSINSFYTQHGLSRGVGMINNQLHLFNLFQTYPTWRNLHSNTEFRIYAPSLIGYSFLDIMYRFKIVTAADASLSQSAIKFIGKFHEIKVSPRPQNIKINYRDSGYDYKNYMVSVEKKYCNLISDNLLYRGKSCCLYEMSRLKKDPIDLDSPRWWNQVDAKSIDLKDIICDNQMVLF